MEQAVERLCVVAAAVAAVDVVAVVDVVAAVGAVVAVDAVAAVDVAAAVDVFFVAAALVELLIDALTPPLHCEEQFAKSPSLR